MHSRKGFPTSSGSLPPRRNFSSKGKKASVGHATFCHTPCTPCESGLLTIAHVCVRRNLAHSCWSKASLTFLGGFPETVSPGLGKIQAHVLHPQAAKVKFSSQIGSLAILPTLDAEMCNCRGVQYCTDFGLDSNISLGTPLSRGGPLWPLVPKRKIGNPLLKRQAKKQIRRSF